LAVLSAPMSVTGLRLSKSPEAVAEPEALADEEADADAELEAAELELELLPPQPAKVAIAMIITAATRPMRAQCLV
jgi:beta-lactam-binding protein with PASTA domain